MKLYLLTPYSITTPPGEVAHAQRVQLIAENYTPAQPPPLAMVNTWLTLMRLASPTPQELRAALEKGETYTLPNGLKMEWRKG